MRVTLRFAILTIIVAVLVPGGDAGARQAAGGSKQPKSANASVTLSDKDNHGTVDLTTGELLIVQLPANPSTGYAWTVNGDPAPLKLVKHFHLRSKEESGMVGAPQTAVFEFKATSAGAATLTLLYRRSWEYNVPPAKIFTVLVKVR